MRRRLLVVLVALIAGVAATAWATAPASFDLSLERTATGWSATCAEGCAWKTATIECDAACSAIISESGVRREPDAALADDAFAFDIAPQGTGGFRATARHGTAWADLTLDCAPALCRARIDGRGVSRR